MFHSQHNLTSPAPGRAVCFSLRALMTEGHLGVQGLDTDILAAGSSPHYSNKSLLGSTELVLVQGQTPPGWPSVMVRRDWPHRPSN